MPLNEFFLELTSPLRNIIVEGVMFEMISHLPSEKHSLIVRSPVAEWSNRSASTDAAEKAQQEPHLPWLRIVPMSPAPLRGEELEGACWHAEWLAGWLAGRVAG